MTENKEMKKSISPPSHEVNKPKIDKPQREYWSSRLAFYFATAGAAIGFGNVWRFPGLSVQYGGGGMYHSCCSCALFYDDLVTNARSKLCYHIAFFIPYLLALFFIGIPLSILEIGFGQFFQTSDIGVFGGFHHRLRGVGVCSIACGFIVSSYYVVMIGWVVNAFFDSWNPNTPWGNPELTGEEAVSYFYNDIVGMETIVDDDLTPTRLVGKNVAYTALVWCIIFIGTAFGLKTTGRLTYFTMGLPVVLLFIFLARAATLPGAREGVHA